MKHKSKNKIYCIVGIGYHSIDKLIPALTKSGKKIVYKPRERGTCNIGLF